jgi:hypothetical protein
MRQEAYPQSRPEMLINFFFSLPFLLFLFAPPSLWAPCQYLVGDPCSPGLYLDQRTARLQSQQLFRHRRHRYSSYFAREWDDSVQLDQ